MKRYLFLVLLISATVLGCSKNVPLGGRITYSDTGEPLEVGTVAFTNGVQQARATIGKDGEYILGFENDNSGLPPGDYKIYITGAVLSEMKPGKDENSNTNLETPLIDAKYEKTETSGLTCKVDGKTKRFDFKVERAKNAKAKQH